MGAVLESTPVLGGVDSQTKSQNIGNDVNIWIRFDRGAARRKSDSKLEKCRSVKALFTKYVTDNVMKNMSKNGTREQSHSHNLTDQVCGIPPFSSYCPFSLKFLLWGTRKQRPTCGVPLSPYRKYPTRGLLRDHTGTRIPILIPINILVGCFL